MSRTDFRLLLPLLLWGIAALASPAPAAPQSSEDSTAHASPTETDGLLPIPDELRRALMSGDTRAALRLLDQLQARDPERADGWLYFRARALLDAGRAEEAILPLERVEAKHPAGSWVHKARFLRAEILRGLDRMPEAEAIYEQEAERLLSGERQAELVEITLRFARLLSTPADPNDPGAKQPNYARALALYQKALGMQTPRSQREEALWGLARCALGLQDANAAQIALRSYLSAFGEDLENAGMRTIEARLKLAQNEMLRGNPAQARYGFEDLVELLSSARAATEVAEGEFATALARYLDTDDAARRAEVFTLEGEARFAIAGTYEAGEQGLALKIAALERLIEAMPTHPLVGRARYEIATSYRAANRREEAVSAFDSYLAWTEPGDLDQETRETNARFRQAALYQKGATLLELGEAQRAIPIFQDYVGRYPTGSDWAVAQQAMIDAEYQIGAQHRTRSEWAEARSAWQEFLAAHPLDGRAQQIAFAFGQMFLEEAAQIDGDGPEQQELRRGLWRQALDAWERVASKYPNSTAASSALFASGQLYENQLQELDAAIQAYRRCTFGPSAGEARARLQEMTEQQLEVWTPRVWRSNEDAQVAVHVRNSEELTVRLYRLDLEAYFRKHLTHQRIENLDLDLIAADQTLQIPVDGYQEYKPIEQQIVLPVEGAGVWAVAVDDGERRATTLVVRSDLDMIVKSSRREFFVYVQDMLRERPASGVELLVAMPDPNGGAPKLHTLKTGRDGVASIALEDLVTRPELRVLATRSEHYASDGLTVAALSLSESLQPRGYVYPDRPAYRPGQRVHWRGVLREVADGRFAFRPGTEYEAQILDSQGRVVRERRLTLSDFGTVHDSLVLPTQAPLGNWTIRLRRGADLSFQGSFQVQEFALQTVGLDLEFDQPVYYRGELVRATVDARYYYGEPVADQPLKVGLPDGRQLDLRTDAEGRARFEFPTRDITSSQMLAMWAQLPDEGVTTSAQVPLSSLGYSIAVAVDQSVVLAGNSFVARVMTSDAAGEPVGRELQLQVQHRQPAPGGGWRDVTVQELSLETSEDGVASQTLTLEEGGTYRLQVRGTDRFGNPVVAIGSVFVSGDADTQRLRILAERNVLPVGEDLKLQLINRTEARLALLTFEGERMLRHQLIELEPGSNALELPTELELAPNFRLAVALMEGNRFHRTHTDFELQRKLALELKPRAEVVAPGEEVVIDVTARDESGRPVRAEVALAAVDESIFAQFASGVERIDLFFARDARRHVGFETTSSCEFRYEGHTKRIDAAILAEAERLQAEERWKKDREALRSELLALSARRPGSQEAVGLSAGLEPSEIAYLAAPDFTSDAAFDAESWNDTIGVGGGAGGAFGGRFAGRSRGGSFRGPSDSVAFFRDRALALNEIAAGEIASWVNAGLAVWAPQVLTDAEGRAEVRFTMPERSTEWRLTARGVGEDDHFGEARSALISKAPFFVELRTPPALTEGDRPVFLARLHNASEQVGTVRVRLRVDGGDAPLSQPAELTLDPSSQKEHAFVLDSTIPLTDQLIVSLEAVGDFAGETRSARAAAVIPVRPWGMEVADFASGVLQSESVFELALPSGSDYRDRVLELSFGSSLADLVVDAALDRQTLLEVKQRAILPMPTTTASRLIGVAAALQMIEALRLDHPAAGQLRDRAEALAQALVAAQNEDGGWNWSGVKERAGAPEASARVMHALADARRRGIAVDQQALDRGVNFLLQSFQNTGQRENERKAMLLYALARHGQGDFGTANRLHRLRNELSPAALAYTALALAHMERAPMARELAERLVEQIKPGGAVDVNANMAFHRGALEMTALAALVLQESMPRAPQTQAAIEHLLAHRPWHDARTRGFAAAAVAKWAVAQGVDAEDVVVVVEIDGEAMEIELDKGQFNGFTQTGISADRVRIALQVRGRSRPYFQAALRAFTRDMKPTTNRELRITRQLYEAAQPVYHGRAIPTGFGVVERFREAWHNEVTQLERGGSTRVQLSYYHSPNRNADLEDRPYMLLRIPLPAGTTVLEGSVTGNFIRQQQRDHELVLYLGQHYGSGWVNYQLIGAVPGNYRVLPPRLEDAVDPSRFAIGESTELEILRRGRASTDEYRETPDELYHLGLAALEHGDDDLAYRLLSDLYERFGPHLRDHALAAAAGKLLFLAIDRGTPAEIVRYFEVLKEKDPSLNIPFQRVLSVGRAYRALEEYERALLVFRATIEESFGRDLKVAGTLEEQGEPAGALGVLERLWLEFPDLPVVIETYLTLSDKLLTLAPEAYRHPGLVASGLDRAALTKAGISLLQRFLALYHADPLAPDAGLNLVSAFLDLEDFETGVVLAQEMANRFEKPRYRDAFRYSEAVASWYQGEEDAAVKTLRAIADAEYPAGNGTTRPSENRDLALYILAQIHHARKQFGPAAEYYERIQDVFADAREVLQGFRAKQIALDEVTEVPPGEAAEIELRYRNVEEAELLVYRVDLMTLYLRERNLSQITAVNLAGIAPTQRKTVRLDSATGMREAEQKVRLKLDRAGAYLVICRGDELHTSGLVLVSDIELEVEEDLAAGRLRIQALDREEERFVRDVDVRVVGSRGGDFVAGRTDPRGIFLAEGIAGAATVIARHGEDHYAFFRGTPVGPPTPPTPGTPSTPSTPGQQQLQQLEAGDYLDNVFRFNSANQATRAKRLENEIQRERKGVSVGQTRSQ